MGLADWWDQYGSDVLDIGLDLYNYNQSQDAIADSEEAVQQGFQMQNPWSVYQPAMGAGLMNLLANPGQVTQTPGYQFAYDQGLQSLFAKQAASGHRFSGRALEETMQFGQGLASQMYNQEINKYAQLAGANQGTSGGIETGQSLSQLGQQGSFNQGYLLNQLFQTGNSMINGGGGSTTPTGGSGAASQGTWQDPYNEDSVN